MISSQLRSKIDFWVVGLLLIAGVSMAMVVNLVAAGQASAFTLQQTAPKRYYSDLATPDGCYSNLNAVGKLGGLFGSGQWGLVNAIVNMPVYDWDQGTGPALYHVANMVNTKGALRGPVLENGQAVGYVHNFDFTETPLPNPYWVMQWLMNPEPPVVPKSNGDYVANPFIYQQFAAIAPSGLPIPALINGNQVPEPAGGDTGTYSDATGGIDQMGDIINNNDHGKSQTAQKNSGVLHDKYTPSGLQDPDFIGQLASGVFGFASHTFGVRGDKPVDNCFESMSQGSYAAPTYAFSAVNLDVPVTIPGWAYSPITFFDGKGFSSSGVTFYLGGTINNKFILDCYGRGKQPIVVPAGYGLDNLSAYNPGQLGSAIANGAMAAAVIASTPPICFIICVPNPFLIAQRLRSTPAIKSAWENYFYGFAFAFKVHPERNFTLPDYLRNRVINLGNSKFFDVNPAVLAANPAICGNDYHKCSENGAQFNPDLYVTLKEPYVLDSEIDFSTNDYHRTPDGQSVSVSVDGLKNGFETSPYQPYPKDDADPAHSGGPTYNDNAGPNGRAFTKASVYRIVMKPGVVPNAIDVDKLDTSKPKWEEQLAYRGDPATNDVCSFLHGRLNNGDGWAVASRVPDDEGNITNANEHRAPFHQPDAYDCNKVKTIDVRMDTGEHEKSLYSVTEKIPAETPPGTKICYAVYYDHYTNDIKYRGAPWWRSGVNHYNSNYAAPDDSSYLSRVKCIVTGYKPSFQVRGGDLIVGQNIYTNTNLKDDLTHKNADGSYDKRIYGSWTEYGTIAGGVIKHLGTGAAYRLGMPQSLTENGPLTFANDRNPDNLSEHTYGAYTDPIKDGFDKISNRFSQATDIATQLTGQTTVKLNELPSGTYRIDSGTVRLVVDTADQTLARNKSLILLLGEDVQVNIASNIRIPIEYETVGEISQVVLAPQKPSQAYHINVSHKVTQVDAWLINQQGSINTCWIKGATPPNDYRLIPRSLGECDNTLYVNGPVAARTIYLRRNGGKDQSSDPTKLEQSVPGEVFNLRPDAYIWAANHVDSANKKYITTHVLDLPPRY